MKNNSFGVPYFNWCHGFVFNEGGHHFTFQMQWFKGLQFIFRLWCSSVKRLHRELEIKIDLHRTDAKRNYKGNGSW